MSSRTVRRPVLAWLMLSFFSLSAVCYLLWHHPKPLSWTATVAMLFFLLSYMRPQAVLTLLLMLFPCFSFAPWTGWLVFEEIDLLMLLFCAGTLLRAVLSPLPMQPSCHRVAFTLGASGWLLALPVTAYALYSVWHGIAQAGDFSYRWWTNYQTAENAIRTGKALLLAPLVVAAILSIGRQQPDLLVKRMIQGMTAGLLITMLGCIYERAIFTGLANLSTDYRTTAWFWEMHLGGAALDAYLAVTVPFALANWRYCQKPWQQLLMLFFYLIMLYVLLTTFSRAVYLAVPVAVFVAYQFQQRKKLAFSAATVRLLLVFVLLIIAGTLAIFPEGGYRASFALTASLLLLWTLLHAPGRPQAKLWWLALLICALLLSLQLYLPRPDKLPYLMYTSLWLIAAAAISWLYWRTPSTKVATLALFTALLSLNQLVVISAYWSEQQEYQQSLLTVFVCIVFFAFISPRYQRQDTTLQLPTQAVAAGAMLGAWLICAMVSASSYLDERFSTVDRDSMGRLYHWQQALDVQAIAGDLWTGTGYGRFTDATYKFGPANDKISTFTFIEQQGESRSGTALSMHTGNHANGYGEVLRITQQVVVPTGTPIVKLDIKTQQKTEFAAEVCQKQLLYRGSCARGMIQVLPQTNWQQLEIPLNHEKLQALDLGPWPNLMFMIYSTKQDNTLLIDNIQLIDATGRDLLSNGSFEQQMQSWFFTSDRNHMPYHLKNLPMHILFEQGVVGVLLTTTLIVFVLARTLFGRPQQHPLAPLVAGALVGLLLIGLFDSVIDAGRMAMMFYLLLWLGAALTASKISQQPVGSST